MRNTLDDLLDYLDHLAARATLPELLSRLQQVRIDVADLADHIHFADDGYISTLMHSGPWHQVYVFCWRNGQRSPVHDHAATTCAVRVLRGVATETVFERAADGRVRRVRWRELQPGDLSGMQDLDIHEIANRQPGDADLVTLHVYSPPMGDVGIYRATEIAP